MQNKRGLNFLTWLRRRRSQSQDIFLEKQQTAKLIELGIYLQQFRLEQSISIEQIAHQTNIQPRLLRAIEAGSMDQLPEPVFIQGYIKLFAQSLGLDGVELAKTFPVDKTTQEPAKGIYLWLKLPFLQLRPMHLYVLYAFLIVGAVNSLSYVMDRPLAPSGITPAVDRESFNQPTASQSAQADKSSGTNSALSQTSQLASVSSLNITEKLAELLPFTGVGNQTTKSVQVSVTLKEQSWLRVVADDEVVFEEVASEGTQQTWSAEKQVTVRAGNAGGVWVTFNNQPEKPLGLPGSVEELTFKADSKTNPKSSTQALAIP